MTHRTFIFLPTNRVQRSVQRTPFGAPVLPPCRVEDLDWNDAGWTDCSAATRQGLASQAIHAQAIREPSLTDEYWS